MPYFFDVLSLSENGFGVAQTEEIYGPQYLGPQALLEDEYDEIEEEGNDFALDGDEIIFFQIPYFFQEKIVEEEFLEEGDEFNEIGGTGFAIDYKVLGGSGTVEIGLFDFDEGLAEEPQVLASGTGSGGSARRRGAEDNRVEAEMSDGDLFEMAGIRVTGDLEIAVTGISINTNFDSDILIM